MKSKKHTKSKKKDTGAIKGEGVPLPRERREGAIEGEGKGEINDTKDAGKSYEEPLLLCMCVLELQYAGQKYFPQEPWTKKTQCQVWVSFFESLVGVSKTLSKQHRLLCHCLHCLPEL